MMGQVKCLEKLLRIRTLFMQRLQVEKTWRACYASKVQGQSRANIHYRRMKCNELPCSVVGSLKKGRRDKHLNCERNCQWNPVGHVQKARGMEACFVISHGTAPDSRRLQAKLEAFKLLWTCFKYALYVWSSESVSERRHFIYFIDSVDCGSFCRFFCVSFSLHTELWSERGLCGRSWTSWVDQLLLGCKMLHGFTSRTS